MFFAFGIAVETGISKLVQLAGVEPAMGKLPYSLKGCSLRPLIHSCKLVQHSGIEPLPQHWQCRVLPLY
jgi:hypothetical protein